MQFTEKAYEIEIFQGLKMIKQDINDFQESMPINSEDFNFKKSELINIPTEKIKLYLDNF